MLTNQYVSDCRTRIVNLIQIAMHSAYRQELTSAAAIEDNPAAQNAGSVSFEKIDMIRN